VREHQEHHSDSQSIKSINRASRASTEHQQHHSDSLEHASSLTAHWESDKAPRCVCVKTEVSSTIAVPAPNLKQNLKNILSL
jgi:hypothetical protein